MGEPRKEKEAVEDFSQYENLFRENLNQLLEVIFNPEIAFNQTDNEDKCSFCDFRGCAKDRFNCKDMLNNKVFKTLQEQFMKLQRYVNVFHSNRFMFSSSRL